MNQMASHLGGFFSGASLADKVARNRDKHNIYTHGLPAYTHFYIQEGGVRLVRQEFISYDKGLELHRPLSKVLRSGWGSAANQ
jgi:hypothetical protein